MSRALGCLLSVYSSNILSCSDSEFSCASNRTDFTDCYGLNELITKFAIIEALDTSTKD